MPIKPYKPTTPGRRKASVITAPKATSKPPKRLLETIKKKAGRNNTGRITVRHRGGGVKRKYRKIDFFQDRYDEAAEVISIEYDPNRSAFIARIQFPDGEQRYIICPEELQLGAQVLSSKKKIKPQTGNRMPLEYIPGGFKIHTIELEPGKGAKLVRSAGMAAELLTVEGKYAQVKMPSSEVRLIFKSACASIGTVSNSEHRLVRLGKAGRNRHKGIRPTVRGKAMNPVDHRHGGGEGAQPIGLKRPVTKWGKPALGTKTRKKKKWTSALIVKKRKRKK